MYNRFGKRWFDLFAAAIGLIVASPLMLLIALAVRSESPGPIFFRQERVGRNREKFTMLKFRSMWRGSNHSSDSTLLTSLDGRITRVGRILRRFSLDELPQLLNVLKGQMSLVGPRPIIPEQLDALDRDSDDRFKVRPGLTGLAQINGRRSLSWLKQLEYDVEYARAVSLAMDFTVIIRSFRLVLFGVGVYGTEDDNWRRYIRRK